MMKFWSFTIKRRSMAVAIAVAPWELSPLDIFTASIIATKIVNLFRSRFLMAAHMFERMYPDLK